MKKSGKKRLQTVFILGLLTAIGPFSIDMYLPAFPAIARELNTTVAQVMLSLSSFFIGVSAGQLLYGPLLERYGRKKPLYLGLSLYLLASVGCALATSIEALILFRFFQALGGCAGMVAARAMVRDLFEVKENAKIFSTLMLVVALSPIIAPTAGGYVTAAYSWRIIFGLLIIVNLLIIVGVYFLLPESKLPDAGYSLRPKAITQNFFSILIHPQFYVYALTGAIASSGLYVYISGSPQVFITIFQVSEKVYGWIFAIIAVGIISFSQLNTLALKNYTSEQLVLWALVSQTGVGITLVATVGIGFFNLYSVIILIFLFVSCQGFIFPNTSALSLAAFGHSAGNASAMLGAVQLGIGAGASALVSVLQNDTALPMAGVMACCPLLALTVYCLGRKGKIKRPTLKETEEEEVKMISSL
ncbi:MAG: multidrug effflux MFS transporter [Bacteroidetes bacterium]|nr:multidrug effflux MFS transporter [Bacteroidota bacterium]